MGKAAWSRASTNRIIVGTASAFHAFGERYLEFYNESYVLTAKEHHPDVEASVSIDEFRKSMAGWVKVKYGLGASVFGGQYQPALIPVDLEEQIGFSSGVGAAVANQSGDLVAGKTNVDGSFVVDAVLCKDGPGFLACVKQYERGYFDADSGIQLTRKFTPMVPGRRIDVSSYRVLD